MSRFIDQLKRRNVPRAAILYIGVAWLVIQVVGAIGDLVELPDNIGEYILIALAAGFPVAMVLSWFYQFTASGIRPESDAADSSPMSEGGRQHSDKIIIAVLSIAVILFVAKEFINWKGEANVGGLVDLGRQQLIQRTDSSVEDAEKNFRRAIEIDENSAPAYAGLGEALLIQSFYQSESEKEETYTEIEQIVDKGQVLDPELGEFYALRAFLKGERDGDLDASEQLFLTAIELSPEYVRGLQWYAELLWIQRRLEEALAQLYIALKKRPHGHILVERVMWVRMSMGGRAEDMDLLLQSIRHHTDYLNNYVHMTYALIEEGRIGEALKWARHITKKDPTDVRRRMNLECWCLDLLQQTEELGKCVAAAEKDFAHFPRSAKLARLYSGSVDRAKEEANALMQSGPAESVLQSEDQDERRVVNNLIGMIPDILADGKEWDVARDFQEWLANPVFTDPDWVPSEDDVSPNNRIVSAIINAAILHETGDKEKGDRLFDLALDRINSEDLTLNAGYSYRQIWVHAVRGDKAAALAYLKVAMVDQWQLEDWDRLHDPVFDLLLDEPEWQEMLANLEARAATQWQWYEEHKDEPLFSPL